MKLYEVLTAWYVAYVFFAAKNVAFVTVKGLIPPTVLVLKPSNNP